MEERSRGRFWMWAAPLVLVALPVLYLASLGPVVWMYKHGWLVEPVANAAYVIYEPLSMLADHWTAFDRFLEWYTDFFRQLPP